MLERKENPLRAQERISRKRQVSPGGREREKRRRRGRREKEGERGIKEGRRGEEGRGEKEGEEERGGGGVRKEKEEEKKAIIKVFCVQHNGQLVSARRNGRVSRKPTLA